MSIRERVERIAALMRELGNPGTAYQISQVLGVSQSTVSRWLNEKSNQIQSRAIAESLEVLERTLAAAVNGNGQAKSVCEKIFNNPDLSLRSGVKSIVVLLGIDWLVRDYEVPTSGSDDAEEPKEPRRTSRRRASQRRPSSDR